MAESYVHGHRSWHQHQVAAKGPVMQCLAFAPLPLQKLKPISLENDVNATREKNKHL